MNKDYILILIDLQEDFIDGVSDKDKVIENCILAASKAIEDNQPIIIIEYEDCGKTINEILAVVKKYNKLHFVEKYDCDGSKDICRFLLNNDDLNFKKLRFGGIYTNECVADTVLGLLDFFKSTQLQVIEPACGSCCEERHEAGIDRLKDFGIKIVKS